MKDKWKRTTVAVVRKGGEVAMAGDGQVTFNQTVLKAGARKVRRIFEGKVLAGFAGSTADAFTLLERYQGRLEEQHGNLLKAAVSLAKDWRTDKMLRHLEAMLLVADLESTLLISGSGDVVEPEGDCMAIGSGGSYALTAARALLEVSDWNAEAIVKRSLELASDVCVYTNKNILVEVLKR